MLQLRCLQFVFMVLFLSLCCTVMTGCSGGKDVPAKATFDEKDKQQIEEYKKQATDEWGRKIK